MWLERLIQHLDGTRVTGNLPLSLNARFADHSARIARPLHTAKIWVATCTVCPYWAKWPPAQRAATANPVIPQNKEDSTRQLIHYASSFRLLQAVPLRKIFESKADPRSQFEMTAWQGVRADREVSKTDQ
jgi:hypothetical protein